MTDEAIEAIEDMLGAPSVAQVQAASKFLQSFPSSTAALVAMVAAMRDLGQFDAASIVESICEDTALTESETM